MYNTANFYILTTDEAATLRSGQMSSMSMKYRYKVNSHLEGFILATGPKWRKLHKILLTSLDQVVPIYLGDQEVFIYKNRGLIYTILGLNNLILPLFLQEYVVLKLFHMQEISATATVLQKYCSAKFTFSYTLCTLAIQRALNTCISTYNASDIARQAIRIRSILHTA